MCVKLPKFLSPLYLAGLLSSLLTIFTIFLFKKKIVHLLSEFWSGCKGQACYLSLDKLFPDAGDWRWSRKENLATSLFFDQTEHVNFLVNQESVTLSVTSLFTPSPAGGYAAGKESFQEAGLDNCTLFYQPLV